MNLPFRLQSFRHGVHPDDHKQGTEHLVVEHMPFVGRYVLPLGQGGKPAKPTVTRGQRVRRGERIAAADGFVSTSLHAPVDGTIVDLGRHRHPNGDLVDCIEIEADAFSLQTIVPHATVDPDTLDVDNFVAHVQQGGIVGLGGAAFPAHVKYKTPAEKPVRHFVLNGCECEPFLTCDHRTMVERPAEVLRGARIIAKKLGATDIHIGVEHNKPDAVAALRAQVLPGEAIHVTPLEVKYPQGAEKMLIKALFGQEVPAGKLPLDIGCVVNNVGTMVAIADWFDRGIPLIERVVTVSGPGVRRPANVRVPLGTPVRDLLAHCAGTVPETREFVMGGPMMGSSLASIDVPVLKGTSGVLAFTAAETARGNEFGCLKCGRCLDACANFLNPSVLARLSRHGELDALEANFVMDCMECGACSFTCPSNIPIVQLIRVAKSAIRDQKRKEKKP
ncbi:MAG: electron transport complex subunit RsxC [Planctomycetes bacterium]|nr:electron transport complex subunit RsxC [Planctomycetota bacterium]MCC7398750.1 electron transport complex subunit RsxC [Planctomycetota bacterium]